MPYQDPIKNREYAKAWNKANPERRREINKASYERNREKRCAEKRKWNITHKEQHVANALAWQRAHPERKRANANRSNKMVREEVINHYGGKCACCGEMQMEFLAIDHVNGGGNKHRREIGRSTNIYRWLRRNNYPDGFGVLCHNCNMAKGFYGICPHEKEQRRIIADVKEWLSDSNSIRLKENSFMTR